VGGLVRRGVDIMRISEADNDKQEIDRIVSNVANFSSAIALRISTIVVRLFTASLQE
jgi:hypothetical protein